MKENFLEHTIGIKDYITGNRFIDICEKSDATFCKTDYISQFKDKDEDVFITHNSDYHINKNIYPLGPRCNLWLAQNKDIDAENIQSIPIGLENMQLRTHSSARFGTYSSEVKGAVQKAILIDKYASYGMQKDTLVYMNFNIQTYPNERSLVWDLLSPHEWVTNTEKLSLQKFYFDLASSKFVISPRGNGVDCHRTWEALYLKTIPIVKRSLHMNDFCDLPIYFIDDWSELSYNKLNEYYEKVEDSLFDLDMMRISWWEQHINERLSQ